MRILTVAVTLLLIATVLAFRWFDAGSHSASDTLRPLVIVMAPVWTVGIAALVLVRRRRTAIR